MQQALNGLKKKRVHGTRGSSEQTSNEFCYQRADKCRTVNWKGCLVAGQRKEFLKKGRNGMLLGPNKTKQTDFSI